MEHKFRGKRTDNGDWVYGYYICYGAYHYIIEKRTTNWAINPQIYVPKYIEVHPDSVGMWTGKKDKNSVDVYSGQKLKDDFGGIYSVVWIDLMASFWVVQDSGQYRKYTAETIEKLEVIGNTTDNPELLGE